MMMSKPASDEANKEEDAPPAFAAPPKLTQVQQLEKQLEMLSGTGPPPPAAAATAPPAIVESKPPPSFDTLTAPPAPPPATTKTAPSSGGKKDLLVSYFEVCFQEFILLPVFI